MLLKMTAADESLFRVICHIKKKDGSWLSCLCINILFDEAHLKSSLKSFISKEESAACPVYSIAPIMSAALSLCSLLVSSHAAW